MMLKIEARKTDLGGRLTIHRVLPERIKRMIGPFCFLDHMGPLEAKPNQDTDVKAHPHIGLSTLTYLFEGSLEHRDSIGSVAIIEPGGVNWMTAGSGVSHVEKTPIPDRGKTRRLHGLQFWVALPDGQEEVNPSFVHYDQKSIPSIENDERKITLVAGEGFGLRSPVKVSSPLVFAIIEAKKDFELDISGASPRFELGLYVIQGSANGEEINLQEHQMVITESATLSGIKVSKGSRLAVIGGEPFATPRHIWWNMVSSSRERIEISKRQWKDRTFPMVSGETEFVPLPG